MSKGYILNTATWLVILGALLSGVVFYVAVYLPMAPLPGSGVVFVTNSNDNSIVMFEIDSETGRVANTPSREIKGPNTGLCHPRDIELVDDKSILVSNLCPGGQSSVTIYDYQAYGDAVPEKILTGPNMTAPFGIVYRDGYQTVMVANESNPVTAILEFPATGSDVVMSGCIGCNSDVISCPTDVSLGLSLEVYISETCQNAIKIYTVRTQGMIETPPVNMISGGNTLLDHPQDIEMSENGILYVMNRGHQFSGTTPSITIYNPGALAVDSTLSGDISPIRQISGSNTGLKAPYGIAVDKSGRIFSVQLDGLYVFDRNADGNTYPTQILRHESIKLSTGGVAVN